MKFLIHSALLSLSLLPGHLFAETWLRGSAAVVAASGQVRIDVPGDGSSYQNFDQTKFFPGIFNCTLQNQSSVLIYLSNGVVLDLRGAGFLSSERLEVLSVDGSGDGNLTEQTTSRMILNFRKGELIIDARQLPENSKLVLETPVGRVTGTKAMMLVQLESNNRSGTHDLSISCAEGVVRFTDTSRQAYTIYQGQRLSGAGSSLAFSVEAGGQSEEALEKFALYAENQRALEESGVELSGLKAHISPIEFELDVEISTEAPNNKSGEPARRPRIIKFAAPAKPVTPFRGEFDLPF